MDQNARTLAATRIAAALLTTLPARQLQILAEISRGLTDKEIARTLRLSPRTVEMHVANALAALDCRSRAEAVRKAGELGVRGPGYRSSPPARP